MHQVNLRVTAPYIFGIHQRVHRMPLGRQSQPTADRWHRCSSLQPSLVMELRPETPHGQQRLRAAARLMFLHRDPARLWPQPRRRPKHQDTMSNAQTVCQGVRIIAVKDPRISLSAYPRSSLAVRLSQQGWIPSLKSAWRIWKLTRTDWLVKLWNSSGIKELVSPIGKDWIGRIQSVL